MEIELKLLVAPEDLARIAAPGDPGGAPGWRAEHTRATVYYDTPAPDLARAGVALRVRRDGNRSIQTLKEGGGAAAGLHVRDEIEWDRSGHALDVALLDSTPYAELFAKRGARPPAPGLHDRVRAPCARSPSRTARSRSWPWTAARSGPVEPRPDQRSGTRAQGRRCLAFDRAGADDRVRRPAAAGPREQGRARLRARARCGAAAESPGRPARCAMTAGAGLRRIAIACVAQMQANEAGCAPGATRSTCTSCASGCGGCAPVSASWRSPRPGRRWPRSRRSCAGSAARSARRGTGTCS